MLQLLAIHWIFDMLYRWLAGWMQPDEMWMLFGIAISLHYFSKYVLDAGSDRPTWPKTTGIIVFFLLLLWFVNRDQGFSSLGMRVFMSGALASCLWQLLLVAVLVDDAIHRTFGVSVQRLLARMRQSQGDAPPTTTDSERRIRLIYDCQLLYDRHASEIRRAFPRKRFDEYVANWLGEDQPAEVLNERAQKLQELIRDLLEEPEVDSQLLSPLEINQHFQQIIQEIESRAVDQDTKHAMLAEAYFAQERALRTGRID